MTGTSFRNYRADKSHRLQLFKSKTGDRKYEHEKRDVNMNNQMKHVLVLDTINSTRNGSFHRSEKKVGITFMSHEQVLVERDSRSPHEAQNQNNINSFDDDGLKRSCAKYKDSERTLHGGCTYVTYNNGGFQTLV